MNVRKAILRTIIGIAIIGCVTLTYAYLEARSIRLTETTIVNDDIPEGFDGKKLIFISDIHCNQYFDSDDVAKLVKRVNSRNPDIIVLGGDNTEKDSKYSLPFFGEISKLKSKHGVFSVLGNHDHWEDAELIQKGLKDCGFHICDNNSYWIKEGKDSIKIGGVGDLWEDEQLIDSTVGDVAPNNFCILLSHNPDYIERLYTDRIDLMLSGHTHGGQITLFGLYAPIMPSTFHPQYTQTGQKYRYGWTDNNGIKIYTTSGIGMGTFPLRLFARPEIVEITLKRTKPDTENI